MTMMFDRRQLMLSGSALAAGAALPISAFAASEGQLGPLFDRLFEARLRRSPEMATNLGLDKGANAAAKGRYAPSLQPESLADLLQHL